MATYTNSEEVKKRRKNVYKVLHTIVIGMTEKETDMKKMKEIMEGSSDYVGEATTLDYETHLLTQKTTLVGTGESKAAIRDDKDDDDIITESENSFHEETKSDKDVWIAKQKT